MANPRSIAVIDVGSTNTKLFHIAPDLSILESQERGSVHKTGPPYLSIDAEAVIEFSIAKIREFDRSVPVDAIVSSAHGSSLALLDERGQLALPIMAYMAEIPSDIATAYELIEPPFTEVLSPTNPVALTLGRQLLWQETRWPEEMGNVSTILPYAQYIGYRLSGVAASEVTSLGAQTHLWDPRARGYSSLAKSRGWDRLFAPIRDARDELGPALDLSLRGKGMVYCGVHDSNANFWRYQGPEPVNLVSTGTWIIAFDSAASVDTLDGTRDQVSNTTITGDPIACCRFMGGEEYARLSHGTGSASPSLSGIDRIIKDGIFALPSFTDSGGPVPRTGGLGTVTGGQLERPENAASLAALYTAEMTALALNQLGDTERIVIDGAFASNPVFVSLLARLMPDRRVLRSLERHGTATGAASLALSSRPAPPETEAVEPAAVDTLCQHYEDWIKRIENRSRKQATSR